MRWLHVAIVVCSWSAVFVWMAMIFYASATPDAGDIASSRLGLFPKWTWEWIYHGAAFGGFTVLTYIALRVSLPWGWQTVAVLSLAAALAYGLTDEWHQSYVSGRSADIRDVGRDGIGAILVILLARAASVGADQLLRGRWERFGRVAGGTVSILEGITVVWLVALWMLAGPENSFSLGSLRPSELQGAVIRQPLALGTGLPFLGVAIWVGLGFSRTLGTSAFLLLAPSLSTLLLLGVPFLAYGLDVIPDTSSVWVATWIAAAAVWSLAVWPFAAAVSVRLKWARSYDTGA